VIDTGAGSSPAGLIAAAGCPRAPEARRSAMRARLTS
jgi:hypothetical protein